MSPRSIWLVCLLVACDPGTAPGATARSASSAAAPSASARPSAAPSTVVSAPPSAAPSAPADACLPEARRSEEQHFCIKLPDGHKPKEWQELEDGWTEESLYDRDEDVIVLTWQPNGPNRLRISYGGGDVATLKELAAAPSKDEKLIGSGELPGGGFWLDTESGDKRRIASAVKTSTHSVGCYYLVPAAKAQIALDACKSLRALE